MSRYRVGCTGWGYDDWRGVFYPSGAAPIEYLERYSRVFDLTEVDSSFYRAPGAFLARRWAHSTPEGFLFSMKLPQEITHKPGERPTAEVIDLFLAGIEPLQKAGKLGPLVAQFPPSFSREKGLVRLDALLEAIPKEYRLAVELRHGSWWEADTYRRLAARGAALVWAVVPFVHVPPEVTADFVYARFVGDRALTKFDHVQRDYRPQIEEMRKRLEQEGAAAQEIYLLVNNHFMGFGPGTAAIVREVFELPPVDLAAAARESGQRALGDFP